MSQPLGNFAKYIGTWYEHYVLPVIPVRATLKIKMDGSTVDPTQLGKVPGQRHRGEWSGFRDWTAHRTHETDLIRWQNWSAKERISACMRTAEMPAIDCDVDNYEDAAMVEMIITNILGPSAIRKRNNSPRFAVFFKWKAGTRRQVT